MAVGRWLSVIILVVSPCLAWAQDNTDWCAVGVTVQSNPQEVMLFKLRCSLQMLDKARADTANAATQAQVETAAANAKLGAALKDLAAARKQIEDETKAHAEDQKKCILSKR